MSEFIIWWKWIWPKYRIYPRLHSTAFYDQITDYELIAILSFHYHLPFALRHLESNYSASYTPHCSYNPLVKYESLVGRSVSLQPIGPMTHRFYITLVLPVIYFAIHPIGPTSYWSYHLQSVCSICPRPHWPYRLDPMWHKANWTYEILTLRPNSLTITMTSQWPRQRL